MGLSQGIVEAAVRRAAGRQVAAVRVRVGGHPVDPEVVTLGFQLAAAGTVAENADLELVMDPMRLHCGRCGHESDVEDHLALVVCPACGGLDIQLTGDDRAVLESIRLQAPAESQAHRRKEAPA